MSTNTEVEIMLSEFDEFLTVDEVAAIMANVRSPNTAMLVFKLQMGDIVNSAWECDVAFGWMELLAFLEGIYPFCKNCDLSIDREDSIPVATITVTPENREGIAFFIETTMFPYWNVHGHMDPEAYWEHAWELHDRIVKGEPLHFPILADDYMANFINDSSGNFESDKDPQSWKLGFWRSNIAAHEGLMGYASSECFVIFHNSDTYAPSLAKLLRSSGENLQVKSGIGLVLTEGNQPLLLTGEWAYSLSGEILRRAHEAICAIQKEVEKPNVPLSPTEVVTSVCQATEMASLGWRGVEICIPCSRLRPNELDHAMSQLLPPAPDIDWSVLDEDSFEELGYDVLIDRGYERVERMGSVYTPDGGRDLVAYRRGAAQTLHYIELMLGPPKKWIFQCKYTRRGQLRLSVLGSFVDVVGQYNAVAYGVITNAAVAPQVYDRLSALKNNPNIPVISDYDVFSGSEISRLVCSRPVLLRKHFRRD